MPDNLKHE